MYTGDPADEFNHVFSSFIEWCEQTEINTVDERRKAFSIILDGEAERFIYKAWNASDPTCNYLLLKQKLDLNQKTELDVYFENAISWP